MTTTPAPRAAIYARVSTDQQTYANQTEILTAWAAQRGYNLDAAAIFAESESAWTEGHQKELSRLLSEVRAGRVKVILVWSLDRLSRQGALAILELVNNLKRWGCKLLSYQEQWTDAPGELGEVLYALAGWVARMESQRRSERTKAGI